MSSNSLIQDLLKAEEDAEKIIQRARENRAKRLQEASASAEAELKQFRLAEEKRFLEEESRKHGGSQDIGTDYLKRSQVEVMQVMDECSKNFDKVVDFMVNGVTGGEKGIDQSIPEIVIRALKANTY